ncbi:MAG: SPASM domain-containing protein, partial [Thermoplasmata archaeon]
SEDLYPWLSGDSQKASPGAFEGKDDSRIGCTAGNSSLYITPDGKIAPCPFLRDFIAGDARKQSVPEIWDGAPTFDIFRNIKRSDLKGKCGECEYLGGSCYGGCRAAAFAHSGDLFAEDPLCWKDMA